MHLPPGAAVRPGFPVNPAWGKVPTVCGACLGRCWAPRSPVSFETRVPARACVTAQGKGQPGPDCSGNPPPSGTAPSPVRGTSILYVKEHLEFDLASGSLPSPWLPEEGGALASSPSPPTLAPSRRTRPQPTGGRQSPQTPGSSGWHVGKRGLLGSLVLLRDPPSWCRRGIWFTPSLPPTTPAVLRRISDVATMAVLENFLCPGEMLSDTPLALPRPPPPSQAGVSLTLGRRGPHSPEPTSGSQAATEAPTL